MNLQPALRLASRQHGALASRQLRSLGIGAPAQRKAVIAGLLIAVMPGVVVVAGSADTWHRRLQIGLLALGPGAFVSHEAAAALHGLDRSHQAVEFTVTRSQRGLRIPGAIVHTTRKVGALDVVTVAGFRCASATRTILDLAGAGATRDRLAAAIDSALRLRLSAPLVLAERLATFRRRGQRGVCLLEKLLIDSGGETILERRFLVLVREAGLPRPATQRRIRSDGRHVARVDFLFAAERVVVEVSGRLGHSAPVDRARDAATNCRISATACTSTRGSTSPVERRGSPTRSGIGCARGHRVDRARGNDWLDPGTRNEHRAGQATFTSFVHAERQIGGLSDCLVAVRTLASGS